MADRRNVLFIIVDSMRSDALGVMGNPHCRTPAVDALAADGVAFRRCFAQHPACAPSRAAILTGWYPHVRGHRSFTHHIAPDEPNLFRYFKQAGYCVKAVGTNDCLHEDCFADSLDEWIECNRPGMDGMHGPLSDDPVLRSAFLTGRLGSDAATDRNWELTQRAVEFLRQPPAQPWLLYVAFYFPHPKYGVPEPWYSMYSADDMPEPIPPALDDKTLYLAAWRRLTKMDRLDARSVRLIRAIYYGMCSLADHYVGQILDALRQVGRYDDTTVVFLSDHGDFTGDHGLVEKGEPCCQDQILNVPLVIKPPAGVPVRPGRRDRPLVESIEVLPTLLELHGIERTHAHHGRSLVGLLADPDAPHKDAVFAAGGYSPEERFALLGMLRRGTPMYNDPTSVYAPKLRLEVEHPEYFDRYACVRTEAWKYVLRGTGPDELYDLAADPTESVNLALRGRHDEQVRSMRDRLLAWYLRTSDVLPRRIDDRLCAAAWDPQRGLRRNTVRKHE